MWFSPRVMWHVGGEHTFVEGCICVWGKTSAVPDAEFLLCTVSPSVLMVMKCETSNINPVCQSPEGLRLRKTHPRTVKVQHVSHLSICSEPSGVTLIAEFFSPRLSITQRWCLVISCTQHPVQVYMAPRMLCLMKIPLTLRLTAHPFCKYYHGD